MDPAAIRIDGITKRFGRINAVKDLDLEVKPGEILGFLGLNGSGKTTTIRILLDLLRPTAGRAFLLGHDCQREGIRVRSRIGYLPGAMGMYGDMTGEALLGLLARLQGRPVDPERRRSLQETLGLSTADLSRRVREYSGGMKRKLGLIQAFQSDPELLILDEPTEGLDPLMQESFHAILAQARGRGATVFMSSHVLSEVERICDRIALLREGRLALCDSVERVLRLAPRRVRVSFGSDVEPPSAAPPPGARWTGIGPRAWSLEVEGPLGPVIASLSGLPILDIEVHEPRLDDVIRGYYLGVRS
ncbi:MAG TPA: ABC transporter ATP-binding protein [Candidatus Polarisedimenticolia bacterium]|jgi:ABC-2 type transport system ATP-binding protein